MTATQALWNAAVRRHPGHFYRLRRHSGEGKEVFVAWGFRMERCRLVDEVARLTRDRTATKTPSAGSLLRKIPLEGISAGIKSLGYWSGKIVIMSPTEDAVLLHRKKGRSQARQGDVTISAASGE